MEKKTTAAEAELESVDHLAHDIFTDPAMVENAKDDPLFMLLKKWWRHLAVVAFAVVMAVYAKGVFDANRRSELANAADTYSNLQQAIAQMPQLQTKLDQAKQKVEKAEGESKEAAVKALEVVQNEFAQSKSRIESVLTTLSESREPYAHFAQLHRAILSIQGGDVSAAERAISGDKWKTISDTQSNNRFYAELDALVLARAWVDQEPSLEKGRGLLRELAQNGSFVAVAAASTFVHIAESESHKLDAKKLLEALQTSHPEQTDLITPMLESVE